MGHVHIEHHIDAPIEHVWDLAMQTERIPEWNPYQEIHDLQGSFDTVGSTFEGAIKVLGRTIKGTGRIVEVEKPRLLHMKVTTSTGEPSDYLYRYEPAGTGMLCTIDIEYEMPGGVLGEAVDRLFVERSIEREMKHVAENFAALAEATAPQPV